MNNRRPNGSGKPLPLSRLLTLLIGLSVIFGLVIWLIDALSRLTWQLGYYGFLGNVLVLLIVALLAVLVGAFVYYFFWLPYTSTNKSTRPPKVPVAKTEAAGETLKAVRRQVHQIQDEVARQALLNRSRSIEAGFSRNEIQVVVFGTGSAGKTSLVNGLLGQIVGQVDAPMGTTTVGETYTLTLRGVNRLILITDTPGILETGGTGTQREHLARQLATEADLLLFVVDNDLRQSEYVPLCRLVEMGKRSLIVLNKSDLYPKADCEAILAKLRGRLRGTISAEDICCVSANPRTIQLDNGQSYRPQPDLNHLVCRMAAVLRAEGENLVADNILLQSQQLGATARHLIDTQRRQQANKIVERFQWIGAGAIAVTPLPVLDLLAAAAVNAQMVVEIGRVYGCDINLDRGRELALSLAKTLASLGIVKGVVQLVTTALQLNLTTVLLGKAIQGVTAAYLTRIAGKSFIEYFRQDQDWGDGGITEVVQQQFQLNRRDEFVKSFIQQAISKVVEPLQEHPLNLPLTLPSLTNIRVDGEPLELSRTEHEIIPIPLNSFVHDRGASRINSSPDRGSVQSESVLGQMNDWETPRMDENEW